MKPNDQERLTTLENDVEDLKKLIPNISALPGSIDEIKRMIGEGHFCKWNTEIGSLMEFKRSTPDVRKDLKDGINSNSEAITKLTSTVTELEAGKHLMEQIKENQESTKESRRSDNIILYTSLAVILVGVFGNRILDLLIWILHQNF